MFCLAFFPVSYRRAGTRLLVQGSRPDSSTIASSSVQACSQICSCSKAGHLSPPCCGSSARVAARPAVSPRRAVPHSPASGPRPLRSHSSGTAQRRRVKRLVLGKETQGAVRVRAAASTKEGACRQSRQVSELAQLLRFPVWLVVG